MTDNAMISRWNTRVSAASTAPPNQALIQLLEASLLHPESAEGNIRQVIEALGSTAPVLDERAIERSAVLNLIDRFQREPGRAQGTLNVLEWLRRQIEAGNHAHHAFVEAPPGVSFAKPDECFRCGLSRAAAMHMAYFPAAASPAAPAVQDRLAAMFTELSNCYAASKCAASDREEFLRLRGMAEAYQDAAERCRLFPAQRRNDGTVVDAPAALQEDAERILKRAEATFDAQMLTATQQLTKARRYAAHTEESGEVCRVNCEGCNDPVGQIVRELQSVRATPTPSLPARDAAAIRDDQREADARVADSFRHGWNSSNTFRQVAETIAAAIRASKGE